MLGFRAYREAHDTAVPVEPENTSQPQPPQENSADIVQQIGQAIDAWVADLKSTLISPTPAGNQRGLWDRFKGSISNLWHGRYNQNNPYYWKNQLGDLGSAQESTHRLTLAEYKMLREPIDEIELAINEDNEAPSNLRLFRLIDQKAQELKHKIMGILSPPRPQVNHSHTDDNALAHPAHVTPMKLNNTDKIQAGYVIDSLIRDGIIDADHADELKSKLNDRDPNIAGKAFNDLQDLVAKHNEKVSQPEPQNEQPPEQPQPAQTGPEQNQPAAQEEHQGSEQYQHLARFVASTKGKEWDKLTSAEKAAWDDFGGGLDERIVRGCLSYYGISKYPWIMRMGDPRLEMFEKQKRGELQREDKKCSNQTSRVFNRLKKAGRIEDAANPIRSEDELRERVNKIRSSGESIGPENDTEDLNKPAVAPMDVTPAPEKAPEKATQSETPTVNRKQKRELADLVKQVPNSDEQKFYKQKIRELQTDEEFRQLKALINSSITGEYDMSDFDTDTQPNESFRAKLDRYKKSIREGNY